MELNKFDERTIAFSTCTALIEQMPNVVSCYIEDERGNYHLAMFERGNRDLEKTYRTQLPLHEAVGKIPSHLTGLELYSAVVELLTEMVKIDYAAKQSPPMTSTPIEQWS